MKRYNKGTEQLRRGYELVDPAKPTRFELEVERLQLTPEQYEGSAELKTWVKANKNTRYVPEELLTKWNLTVNIDLWNEPRSKGELLVPAA